MVATRVPANASRITKMERQKQFLDEIPEGIDQQIVPEMFCAVQLHLVSPANVTS